MSDNKSTKAQYVAGGGGISPSLSAIFDWLRILGAAGVFFVHFGARFSDALPAFVLSVTQYGQDGLWTSYILSGFLMMFSLSRYDERGRTTGDFYRDRLIRIVPSAWIWLLAIYVSQTTLHDLPMLSLQWVRSILLMNAVIPAGNYLWNGMYVWGSLSAFVCFYIAAPWIYRTVKSYRDSICFIGFTLLIRVVVSAGLAVVYKYLHLNASFSTFNFFSLIFFFALGVHIYYGWREGKLKTTVMVSLIIIVASQRYVFITNNPLTNSVYIGIFLGCLISGLIVYDMGIVWAPVSGLRKYLAALSFPLFLVHSLVFDLVAVGMAGGSHQRYVEMALDIVLAFVAANILHLVGDIAIPGLIRKNSRKPG